MKKELLQYYAKKDVFNEIARNALIVDSIIVLLLNLIFHFLKLSVWIELIIYVIAFFISLIINLIICHNKQTEVSKLTLFNFIKKREDIRKEYSEKSRKIVYDFFEEKDINNLEMKQILYNELEYKKDILTIFNLENILTYFTIILTIVSLINESKVNILIILSSVLIISYILSVKYIFQILTKRYTVEEEIKEVLADILNEEYNKIKETN